MAPAFNHQSRDRTMMPTLSSETSGIESRPILGVWRTVGMAIGSPRAGRSSHIHEDEVMCFPAQSMRCGCCVVLSFLKSCACAPCRAVLGTVGCERGSCTPSLLFGFVFPPRRPWEGAASSLVISLWNQESSRHQRFRIACLC